MSGWHEMQRREFERLRIEKARRLAEMIDGPMKAPEIARRAGGVLQTAHTLLDEAIRQGFVTVVGEKARGKDCLFVRAGASPAHVEAARESLDRAGQARARVLAACPASGYAPATDVMAASGLSHGAFRDTLRELAEAGRIEAPTRRPLLLGLLGGHDPTVFPGVERAAAADLFEHANPLRLRIIQIIDGFAVAPPRALLQAGAARERNIADRARDVTMGMVELGERLGELAGALEIADIAPENLVGLKRADLDYGGWWTPAKVEPITRHVPLDLKSDEFLDRCVSLNGLIVEGLSQRDLRRILVASGVPAKEIKELGGLKLLDLVVRMAQVSHATGLTFNEESAAIWLRLKEEGTDPGRPLEHLFALYDTRIIGAHAVGERQQKLSAALERFGIDPGAVAGGYGRALDTVYDRLAEQMASICRTLVAALGTNAAQE